MTPIEIERSGPLRAQGAASAGSASRRASTCPRSACSIRRRRRRRPASRRSTSSPPSTASRSRPGPSSRSAVERAGASPLRLNYLRGGYSAVPFAHIEIEEPGSAVVIPVAVFDAAGRRRYETGILSAELFVFSVEPGQPRRPDRPAPRRSDPDRSTARRWRTGTCCASGWPSHPEQGPSASAGSRRRACSHEATFRQEVRSRAGRLPAGGAAPGVRRAQPAWPGRPSRRSRSPTASATRSATRSSAPAQIIATMTYGFGEIVRGRVPLTTLGGPDHDRLRGRRRRRAGARPVPVADGGHQHQPRPAELPAGADPRRRAAGVLHAGAVQAPAAVAAGARDRHLRRAGRRRDADAVRAAQRRRALPACRDDDDVSCANELA